MYNENRKVVGVGDLSKKTILKVIKQNNKQDKNSNINGIKKHLRNTIKSTAKEPFKRGISSLSKKQIFKRKNVKHKSLSITESL